MNSKQSYTVGEKVRSTVILVLESRAEQIDEMCKQMATNTGGRGD